MSANHMLLPRGGYDFVQVSPTEYRWADEKGNLTALVLAPEGIRFGWHYFVKSAAPAGDRSGRTSSLSAAFRKTAHTLDLFHGKHAHRSAAATAKRRIYRLKVVARLFSEPPAEKMGRLLSNLKAQNG